MSMARFLCGTVLAAAGMLGAQTPQPPAAPKPVSMADLSVSIEGVVTRVTRSVVQVNVTSLSIAPEPGKGGTSSITREHGVGAVVVAASDCYIVTNAHVIRGANSIVVTLPGAARGMQTTLPAKLIGLDSETDLACVNRVLFSKPRLTLNSLNFGQVTGQSNEPRTMQVALNVYW